MKMTQSTEVGREKILQKRLYMRICNYLFHNGPEAANREYPSISIEQFKTANKYFDALRCPGCFCGACLDLPQRGSNLDESPIELLPIATAARQAVA